MARPDDPVARLLPSPRRVERLPGVLRLDRGCQLVLDSGSPAERRAAAFLAGRLRERAALDLAVTAAPATPFGNVVLAETDADPESFELRVDAAGARLRGDPAGLRYGAEALAQLAAPDGRVPSVRVQDAPALRRRGFLLDISRGKVPRPETIRWLLGLLARLRYNELFLYTEHTFQFEKHPESARVRGGTRRRKSGSSTRGPAGAG